jgi:hypothetical protein
MAEVSLSGRMSSLSESATLALNARVKQMAAEGKVVYNLTAGELRTLRSIFKTMWRLS